MQGLFNISDNIWQVNSESCHQMTICFLDQRIRTEGEVVLCSSPVLENLDIFNHILFLGGFLCAGCCADLSEQYELLAAKSLELCLELPNVK